MFFTGVSLYLFAMIEMKFLGRETLGTINVEPKRNQESKFSQNFSLVPKDESVV